MIERKTTRQIQVGGVAVGGGAPRGAAADEGWDEF